MNELRKNNKNKLDLYKNNESENWKGLSTFCWIKPAGGFGETNSLISL